MLVIYIVEKVAEMKLFGMCVIFMMAICNNVHTVKVYLNFDKIEGIHVIENMGYHYVRMNSSSITKIL